MARPKHLAIATAVTDVVTEAFAAHSFYFVAPDGSFSTLLQA